MLFNVIGYDNQVIAQVEAEDVLGAWVNAGKQYDDILDVRPISEIKIPMFTIDKSIQDIIGRLNQAGYITFNSCSGMKIDHPEWQEREYDILSSINSGGYISFRGDIISEDKRRKIIVAAKYAGMTFYIYMMPPHFEITVRTSLLKDGTDPRKLERKLEEEWRPRRGQTYRSRMISLVKEHGGFLLDSDYKVMLAWEKFANFLTQE